MMYVWPRVLGSLLMFIPLMLGFLTGCSPLTVINTLTPSKGYAVTKDIGFGPSERQKLDVYTPRGSQNPAAVVIFFYGGRWTSGSKDDYKFVAQALTSRGFIVVLPNYRLYPQVKFPVFIEDGAQTIAWTRQNISQYGGNPGQIFLMGHSAGAHTAAMLAMDERYLEGVGGDTGWLAGMIGLAGPYDFLPFNAEDLKDIFGPPERFGQSQPINFVDGSEPPLLLQHGLDDKIVWLRNIRNLAARVREKGGEVTTLYYEGLGHLTILGTLSSVLNFKAPVLDDITAFINEHTGAVPSEIPGAGKGIDNSAP